MSYKPSVIRQVYTVFKTCPTAGVLARTLAGRAGQTIARYRTVRLVVFYRLYPFSWYHRLAGFLLPGQPSANQ